MKSKIKIKLEQNELYLIKETKEDRKERIKYASRMFTKVIPDKTKYSKKNRRENKVDI